MILSQLAVVFVGIMGNHHETVERQLAPTLDKAGASELAIPDADLSAIVTHAKSSRALVKKMHVRGVIAGQLLTRGRTRTFRVVIYDADGNLSSETESPLSAAGLEKVDLDVLAINVGELTGGARPAKRAPVSASHVDDDVPPGVGSPSPKHDTPAKSVALAEDDPVAASPAVEQHAPTSGSGVHLEIGLAVGVVGRVLSTDPNTVKHYSSSPVGTGGFEGAVGIGARTRISGLFEHTLVMHSDLDAGSTASAIGRYQIAATYDIVHDDSVQLAPMVGLGARYFEIDDTTSTTRTPDEQYTYVLLGGTVTKSLGTRWVLRGLAAFEPVVGGIEPKMATTASRWGFDLGAELAVRATAHVFARAAFDYQSFASSWSMVGGMTDVYASGTVAAGATF